MKVAFFHRKRAEANYSIEGLFEELRRRLSADIEAAVEESPHWSKGFLPRLRNGLAARRRQADLNHVTGDVHYLTLFLRKRKTILTVHDCAFLHRAKGLKRLLLWLFWVKLPVMRAQVVTTVSREAKREVVQFAGCKPDKVRVLPNFVHPRFSPAQTPKPFNAERPTVLHIGTKWNKNLERLAEALEGLPCRLVIVGKLSEAQKDKLRLHRVEYENLVGISNEELLRCYRQADLLAFVSIAEGFGLPILEAQACGTPVLTSLRSSMPEVGGEGALYADPLDVQAIRRGVLKLTLDADLRARLVRAGFENARRYSPEAFAQNYLALYRELAARP